MKKFIMTILAVFVAAAAFAANNDNKAVFAYFSGYRCPPCMVFERDFLDDFKKTYQEKYNGRVELKIFKMDIPLHITPDSPEYEEAKKLAQRNSDMLKATGKMNNVHYIGSVPYAVIGETSLDWSTPDLEINGPNVERALAKALQNNETTRLAESASGKMSDYADMEQAVSAGDYKAVQAFLDSGVKPTADNLASAAFNGDEDIIRLLVSYDATIINKPTKWGGVPIAEAAFMGRYDIVEFLLSKDAILPPNIIIAAGIDENMIILLKKHGADINAPREDGHTPLTNVIVNRERMSGAKLAVKYAEVLVRQGADVNLPVTIKDENGNFVTRTPLQLAQSTEMRSFLISHNAK